MAIPLLKRTLQGVLLAVLVLSGAQHADAEPQNVASLKELIKHDLSFLVGDKLFSDFKYEEWGSFAEAGDITVTPAEFGTGLRFSGFFLDSAASDGPSTAELKYTVTVLDSDLFIASAHLQGNPETFGNNGLVEVTENFWSDGNELPNSLRIFASQDDILGPQADRVDWTDFDPPLKSLRVKKRISAEALAGFVGLSFFEQTFVQVPEPASVALMLLGGCAALVFARRRR